MLAGNIIIKDKNCSGNRAVIHFVQDGGNEHNGRLCLVHNTIVTPFISPVAHLSAPKSRAQLYNNIIWDGGKGTRQNGQVLVLADKDAAGVPVEGRCNWVSYGFRGAALDSLHLQQTWVGGPGAAIAFVDVGKGDYRLAKPDPQLVELACALPDDVAKAVNGGLQQYKAPQASEARIPDGKPDLGAMEWRQTRTGPPARGDGSPAPQR